MSSSVYSMVLHSVLDSVHGVAGSNPRVLLMFWSWTAFRTVSACKYYNDFCEYYSMEINKYFLTNILYSITTIYTVNAIDDLNYVTDVNVKVMLRVCKGSGGVCNLQE